MDRYWKDITLSRLAAAVTDMLLPRVCVVCGRHLQMHERHLCLECLADLPYTRFWQVTRNPMADKYNDRLRAVVMDGVREPYACAASLFFYNSESQYKHIPQALKYRAALAQGRYFAAILGRELASSPDFADVDVVVPVPLHWSRRLSRGYNQSEIIASAVASALSARMVTSILRRRRRTRTQTRMSMQQKAGNVLGAFKAKGGLKARHVLIVDDTFTTGATLSACHRALREVLPSSVRISVATLAYVKAS